MTMKIPTMAACVLLAAGCSSAPRDDPMSLAPAQFGERLAKDFQYPAPEPKPQEMQDAREGQAADAAYLLAFPDYDRAYSPAAREEARAELRRLKDEAASLTHEQFVLRVARVAALADNGHTTINENSFRKNTPRIPLRAYWFPDGLHVLRAVAAHADLLGARIDLIDGRAIEEIFKTIRQYSGGTENHRRVRVLPMFESPGLLHAAGVARETHALTLSGVRADGSAFERRIEAEDRDRSAPVSSSPRLLFPVEAGNPEKLQSVLPQDAGLPVYLRDPTHLFTMSALEGGGLYVAIGFNTDADEGRLADFLAKVLARCSTEKPRYVVLDFRMNGGGDYTRAYPFMPALLEVLGGDARVYAFTSAWTFSAAITTVGALKQFGRDRVTIVGEPVGDRLDFWAEGGSFDLPNAFMNVFYTAGRHDYHSKCTGPHCFWLNDFYPVRVPSLEPGIAAPLTYAAYRELRDPALEAVRVREAGRRPAAR